MTKKISDSVIVITGASSGIGRATALELARHGATLVLTARREEALKDLARECTQIGGRALAAPANVTDEEEVNGVARKALDNYGKLDVWINDAAVNLIGRFEDTPLKAYRKVIDTNLFGYIHGARAALPVFREQGSGMIINVASAAGKTGQPFASAYTASNYAIVGLSDSLRMELSDEPNIHVCTVLPGSIDTPLFQHAANYSGRAVQPMPPVYRAEDVADAIVRLIERPRREIVVGGTPRAMTFSPSLASGLTDKLVTKQVQKAQFQDRAVPPTEGNVFKSMAGHETVSGGWPTKGLGRKLPTAALVVGIAALGIGASVLLAGNQHAIRGTGARVLAAARRLQNMPSVRKRLPRWQEHLPFLR